MNMDSAFPAISDDLRGAVLSSYTSVTEDGTICFVSDRVHRTCAGCGTVFVGSACRAAFAGVTRCPYCGADETAPLVSRRLS